MTNEFGTENVLLGKEEKSVLIIDQTKLPNVTEYLELETLKQMYDAIFELKVRGAPAIGICAAYCYYCLAKAKEEKPMELFEREMKEEKEYLNSSRPTAVNLSWALNRMDRTMLSNRENSVPEVVEILKQESKKNQQEDI